jgi:heme-degrading monooxygenase HmoA
MIAKILIKRTFQKGSEKQILPILQKMRAAAMSQTGYISGETLTKYENPQRVTVISTWQDMESWNRWKSNPERAKLESMLEVFQVGPTEFEEFVSGMPL